MNFVFAVGCDWTALYLNGVLVTQNHTLSAIEVLRAMDGYKVVDGSNFTAKTVEVDEDWLEEQGYMPEKLEDVKIAK